MLSVDEGSLASGVLKEIMVRARAGREELAILRPGAVDLHIYEIRVLESLRT